MTSAFEPLKIKSVTLKNRIGMPPMCQYSANNGYVNDWHLVHYGSRAVGGAGLIIVEATGVVPEGRITPYDLGIWDDEHIEGFKSLTEIIAEMGSVPALQIAHAGRKASHDKPSNGGLQLSAENGGWKTVGPSPIPFENGEIPPKELTISEIKSIVKSFADAAVRALKAGFKAIEIHAAHGYLMHEFLSPLTNQRKDEYGSSFENRTRFVREVTEAVRSVWPDALPLLIRLSATDWVEKGWNVDETVQLASLLKEIGVDLIDCSSGGNLIEQKIILKPGYQVDFAEKVKSTGILTSAVGLITEPKQVEEILSKNKADIVLIGRELLRNPYFPLQMQAAQWPEQYTRAKK